MAETKVILTTYGNQKILEAIAEETTIDVASMAYGDANGYAYTPSASQTSLVHQVGILNTLAKSYDEVEGFIYFTGVIPPSAPAVTIRELGLFDTDGGLLAIATVPETSKPDASSGISVSLPISIGFKTSIGNTLTVYITYDDNFATKAWVHQEILEIGTLPSMTGQQNKYLNNDGTIALWKFLEWGEITGTLANQTDLQTALANFLNKQQISNCILKAPNGICTSSGATITIKSGADFLFPNGRKADGTLNNIEHVVAADVTFTNTSTTALTGATGFFTYNSSTENFGIWDTAKVYIQDDEPVTPASDVYAMWFSISTNTWKYTSNGSAWATTIAVPFCTCNVADSTGTLSNVVAVDVFTIAKSANIVNTTITYWS